jgi:probable selenium-dependent hydroxylase accessory protein YqeC
MNLLDIFNLKKGMGEYVSLVGSGGKTTLLFELAHEFCRKGQACVVMTSTHMDYPSDDLAVTITGKSPDCQESMHFQEGQDSGVALVAALKSGFPVAIGTVEAETGKICMPPDTLLQMARKEADWILVEADGSKRLPIKAPASHEPVILEPSQKIIAVAGLSALGKPLSQVCHRYVLASEILGISSDALVTPEMMARLITSEKGQYKNVLDPYRFTVFLNQADDEALMASAREISILIKEFLPGCSVVVGSLHSSRFHVDL